KIITRPHGQTHQPMFEWRVTAEARQFLKGFNENFLNDVLYLAFAARVTADGAEDFRLVTLDDNFEVRFVAGEGAANQFRIGPRVRGGQVKNSRGRSQRQRRFGRFHAY